MAKLPMTFEYSAGGAVFKRENGRVLWLVQERAGSNYWQIPKGHIEKGETAQEAAVREVEEESGIKPRIIAELSTIKYFFVMDGKRVSKQVQWYLMEYVSGSTDNFDPKEVSAAKFCEFDEAYELIKYETEKKILAEAEKLVHTGDFSTRLA